MTRQQKTPRERAEEQLAVEKRRVERLTDQWNKARTEFDRLSKERDEAIVRRDWLAQHPDLAQPVTIHTTQEKSTP